MIDKTALPYIDLGADVETLKQYAKEHFGKSISPLAKDDTVIDRFQAIYEEETGVKLMPVTPLDNDFYEKDDEDEKAVKVGAKPAKAEKPKPTHATIIIQDDPTDPGEVKVGAQFVSYLIKRNVEVKVPIAVLNSLKDAKQTLYNPKTMESKEVLTYPFSVMELHYAE